MVLILFIKLMFVKNIICDVFRKYLLNVFGKVLYEICVNWNVWFEICCYIW